MTYRLMRSGDLSTVAAIEAAANPSPWGAESFRRELENPCSRTDLLLVDGRVAAFLCSWSVADELQIQNVATAAEFRRRGLAAALLGRVLERAARESVSRAFLEVRRSNAPAIELYRRAGFSVTGSREQYYADGEDALLMELDLLCRQAPELAKGEE